MAGCYRVRERLSRPRQVGIVFSFGSLRGRVAIDEIFAGPIMLQVSSSVDTLQAAHRNLDMFLEATFLTDGPAA